MARLILSMKPAAFGTARPYSVWPSPQDPSGSPPEGSLAYGTASSSRPSRSPLRRGGLTPRRYHALICRVQSTFCGHPCQVARSLGYLRARRYRAIGRVTALSGRPAPEGSAAAPCGRGRGGARAGDRGAPSLQGALQSRLDSGSAVSGTISIWALHRACFFAGVG